MPNGTMLEVNSYGYIYLSIYIHQVQKQERKRLSKVAEMERVAIRKC